MAQLATQCSPKKLHSGTVLHHENSEESTASPLTDELLIRSSTNGKLLHYAFLLVSSYLGHLEELEKLLMKLS